MTSKQHFARRLKIDEARAALQEVGQNPHWHWSMGWVEGSARQAFMSACGLLLPPRFHIMRSTSTISSRDRDLCPDCGAIRSRDELGNSGNEIIPPP